MGRSTKDDIQKFHEFDVCPTDSTLYLGSCNADEEGESGVDYLMAERIIKNLHLLDKKDSIITIKMNVVGGDVYHGLAIYDAIRSCKNTVRIIAYGHVMSMGSLIFQAGDERIMTRHARMMLHFGETSVSGHNLNFYKNSEELKKLDKIVNNIYLEKIKIKHPKFSLKKLENMISFDHYLGSDEAITLGLCDSILS